jgi:hypothetical protein
LAESADADVERELLVCAGLVHDIGLYHRWWRGPDVDDGARAAVEILRQQLGRQPRAALEVIVGRHLLFLRAM